MSVRSKKKFRIGQRVQLLCDPSFVAVGDLNVSITPAGDGI